MHEIVQFSPTDPSLAATGGRLPGIVVGLGPIWLGAGAGSAVGNPGLATAPQGSFWIRTDGAAGSSLYVKLASGWSAVA